MMSDLTLPQDTPTEEQEQIQEKKSRLHGLAGIFGRDATFD